MFLAIFIEYIQTRLLFRRMNREQRREYTWQPSDDISNRSRSTSISTSVTLRADQGSNFGALQQREGGIYDKYLILRTFIPLFLLRYVLTDRLVPHAIATTQAPQETN